MDRTCRHCSEQFTITEAHQAFCASIGVPTPTLCPPCRKQRRLARMNLQTLYPRICDLTKEPMVAIYPAETPFPVYSTQAFFEGDWEPLEYGRDFDFSRPFFEQFYELQQVTPRIAVIQKLGATNSAYCNNIGRPQNCYLTFMGGGEISHLYYCESARNFTHFCMDCSYIDTCEQCYQCVACIEVRNSSFAYLSSNLGYCTLMRHCRNCRDCFGCVNLEFKEYCIFNEQYTKEEYEKRVMEYKARMRTVKGLEEIMEEFRTFAARFPEADFIGFNDEDIRGSNYIYNSKNVSNSLTVRDSENVHFSTLISYGKDCWDVDEFAGYSERLYEDLICGSKSMGIYFGCFVTNDCHEAWYSDFCFSIKNCFGCISLRHKEYCILNKQYSKEEYEALLPRIIEHMKATGEWGEFFPMHLSPFGYNETMAMWERPLNQEQAQQEGLQWQENLPYTTGRETLRDVPEIDAAKETVTKEVFVCTHCARNYKIIPQELANLKEWGYPLPELCPQCRFEERRAIYKKGSFNY